MKLNVNKSIYELQIRHLVQTIKALHEVNSSVFSMMKAVAIKEGVKQGIKLEAIEESLSMVDHYIHTDIEEILAGLEIQATSKTIQETIKESIERTEKKMYGNH